MMRNRRKKLTLIGAVVYVTVLCLAGAYPILLAIVVMPAQSGSERVAEIGSTIAASGALALTLAIPFGLLFGLYLAVVAMITESDPGQAQTGRGTSRRSPQPPPLIVDDPPPTPRPPRRRSH